MSRILLGLPIFALLTVTIAGVLRLPPPQAAAQPLPTCTADEIDAAVAALPDYVPTDLTAFVELDAGGFVIDGEPFYARGFNYYPSRYPWRRFLTETERDAVATELDLLETVGVNTLRLFLWNEALFQCPGSGAIPVAAGFERLDGVIALAADRNMRLIVTLNDLPDLETYPLYHNPPHIQQQTAFIVERYREEAAILAWDVRNEGDIDYGSHTAFPAKFSREVVIDWVAETVAAVRTLDERHLITAGWLFDAESTAPYVDFVSFHHWRGAVQLQERIDALQAATDQPLLLQEFGYSTFRVSPEDQAQTIAEVIALAEDTTVGWLIWTAFDFPLDATCIPPACPSQDNAEHHFGLWQTDYTPKPAAAVLER